MVKLHQRGEKELACLSVRWIDDLFEERLGGTLSKARIVEARWYFVRREDCGCDQNPILR